MTGRVFKSTGSWYLVEDANKRLIECRIKGNVRLKGSRNTNPASVGDVVDFEIEPKTGKGVISKIFSRKNYIIRRSTNLSKREHIIASNIDQAALVVCFKNPRTLTGFIDRFLITAEAYGIKSIIVINKIDTYDEDAEAEASYIKLVYEKIGYPVFLVSAHTHKGIEELNENLSQKITLFSGHSGVGKSSLLNTLVPGLNLRVGEVSESNEKGTHTTTFAQMYRTNDLTCLIDTPGVKSFAIVDFKREEVATYFPEMFRASANCKYNNCLHINEPGCAVKQLLEEGEICEHRYENYLNIYESDNYKEDWE